VAGGGGSGAMEGGQKRKVRMEITGSQESVDTILEHKQAVYSLIFVEGFCYRY
jgi:hypothetical protein